MLSTKISLQEYLEEAKRRVRERRVSGIMGFIAKRTCQAQAPFEPIAAPWENLETSDVLRLTLIVFESLEKRACRSGHDGLLKWDEKKPIKGMVDYIDSQARGFAGEEAGLYRELREKIEAVAPELFIAREEMEHEARSSHLDPVRASA